MQRCALFLLCLLGAAWAPAAAGRGLAQAPARSPPGPAPSANASCTTPYGFISDNPDLSVLKEAIDAAGIKATLDDPQLVATVFALSNEGIARTLRDGGATQEQLLTNRQLLGDLLRYHIVPGRVYKVDDLKEGLKFKTLQGSEFGIDKAEIENDPKYAGCNYRDVHLDTFIDEDTEPRQCDIQACQAVLHIVDYLMIPNAPGIRSLLPTAELKASVSG